MKPLSASSLFAAACVAAASAAHADTLNDRTSVVLFAGSDVATPGLMRGPTTVAGPEGTTTYRRLDLEDPFNSNYAAGAEVGYAFDSHLAGFLRASYSQFDGDNRVIADHFPESGGTRNLNARFGDADAGQLDLGARYMFTTGETWRPFVGASLGAVRQSNMFADVDNLDNTSSTRVEIGKASTVFQQRFETGLQYSPMRNVQLRLTAAADHVNAGKRSDDPNLSLLALTEEQSGVHAHWDYPAEIGAVWHF